MNQRRSLAARVFFAFLVARAAFGLVFLGVSLGRWRIFWYYPLERRWSFEAAPQGLAMAWFGATGASLVAAAVAGGAAYLASRRGALGRAVDAPRFLAAIARAGALVLAVDFAYFGWRMMTQTPVPLELPVDRAGASPPGSR
jgi:hypothetical protein